MKSLFRWLRSFGRSGETPRIATTAKAEAEKFLLEAGYVRSWEETGRFRAKSADSAIRDENDLLKERRCKRKAADV